MSVGGGGLSPSPSQMRAWGLARGHLGTESGTELCSPIPKLRLVAMSTDGPQAELPPLHPLYVCVRAKSLQSCWTMSSHGL